MQVSFIASMPQLSPFIAFAWAFESHAGIPLSDSRLIVPDGRAKIIIPYKSAVSAAVNGRVMRAGEHEIFLVGLQGGAVTIGASGAEVGTMGVEIPAKGLYHLFNMGMDDVANRLLSFEELFGARGSDLQSRVADVEDPRQKLLILERWLLHLLPERAKDYSRLDYAIETINKSHGAISMRSIQSRIGYGKRYLDMLFKEHVGVSPKTYASIIRFRESYRLWMRRRARSFSSSDLSDYYYDQSHFTKAFKRFTGFAPERYRSVPNEFGKAFDARP